MPANEPTAMPAIAPPSNSSDELIARSISTVTGGGDGAVAGSAGGSNDTRVCWTSPTWAMAKPAILSPSEVQNTLSSTAPTRVTALLVCVAVGNLVVTVASPSALLTSTEILSGATDRPLSLRIWTTAKVMILSNAASSSETRRPVASNNRRPLESKENEKETMYSCVGA